MLHSANTAHQTNLLGADLLQQLDEGDPLLHWQTLFSGQNLNRLLPNTTHLGACPAKPDSINGEETGE